MRRTEGNYVVTLDGFEHTFTPDQRTDVGAEGPNDALDIEFRAYGCTRRDFNENLDAGHSRGKHVICLGAGRDHEEVQGQDPELKTFVMFGNPTSDFSRVNDMTATYSGSEGGAWAWLHVYASSFDAGNFDWEKDNASLYSTDLEFTANFSRNTISGRIDNFRFWENGDDSDEHYDMTLTMPETEFGTGGFSGTFDVSGQSVRDGTADYDASFWGPDANDVAGTMTITGTDIDGADETPFVGVEHFQAKR
ncbi:MAG: transferrin-binding protein-like solute binding protein [Boseongicola sp.]|nr:transferrin-binding protein-like solute binding protein [Boseongicola sp.]